MSDMPGEDEAHMEFLEERVGLLAAEVERLREENDRLKSMDLHSDCRKREAALKGLLDQAAYDARELARHIEAVTPDSS